MGIVSDLASHFAKKDAELAALRAELDSNYERESQKDSRMSSMELKITRLESENAAKDAEIKRLKAEVAELRKENEGLLKLDVHTLNIVRGRMDATLGGNAVVRIMASSYAEMFRNAGGENFCTSTLTDRSDEENPLTLEVTIRRYPDGKTPEVVIGELKDQLAALRAALEEANHGLSVSEKLRHKVGADCDHYEKKLAASEDKLKVLAEEVKAWREYSLELHTQLASDGYKPSPWVALHLNDLNAATIATDAANGLQ